MKKIQFQMGIGGLIAIFVALVCVLLWAFVLGFWAGKKIGVKNVPSISPVVQQQPAVATPVLPEPEPEPKSTLPVSPIPVEPVIAPPEQNQKPHVTANDLEKLMLPSVAQIEPDKPPVKQTESPPPPAKAAIAPVLPAPKKEPAPAKPKEPQGKKDTTVTTTKPEPKQVTIASATAPKNKTEPAPPAPKPQKEPDKTGKFTLQVAAFKEKAQAEAELNKWKAKGFSGSYKEVNLGNKGTWLRVFIGSYNSEDEAKKAQLTLASQHKVQAMITKK